ncbi:hypothetical protein HDU96_009313 [Phlyctochytrium bullatum]|nr:hypothetical protein HDU96_009313 [Phlyctochytrium bullatum]
MVLNSLDMDPGRRWKGCWRWFDEEMLKALPPLEEVKQEGITFAEFESIAIANGLKAVSKQPGGQTTKDDFIRDIKLASKSTDVIMVVSFCRGTLQQTGTGHFSPIGGYNEADNKVLIFDVARFKYPSYWVSADLLWEALHPIDESTEKPRGYLLLSRSDGQGSTKPDPS